MICVFLILFDLLSFTHRSVDVDVDVDKFHTLMTVGRILRMVIDYPTKYRNKYYLHK